MNKLKKFQPLNLNATINIDSLLKRGGKIVVEKREFVDIQRFQSIARVDQQGRVEWRPA